jgi:hypothetical protein
MKRISAQLERRKMTLVSKFLDLKKDLQSGTIDIAAFNEGIRKAVAAHKASLSDADKAAIFDKLIDYETGILTEQDELWSDHHGSSGEVIIYRDSDNTHYTYEHLVMALFGKSFFNFHNDLYEGG